MDTTFNKMFLQEVCAITKLEVEDALVYIGKSKDNRSKFYKYSTLALDPEVLQKPGVYEALGNTLKHWTTKGRMEKAKDFDWGV